MYDFHSHSHFSDDCGYTMEDMIKGAIKNNVSTLCFTDHMDHDYGNCDFDYVFDVDEYFKTFKQLKEKYSGNIKLLAGVEIGMQPKLIGKIHKLMPLDPFDFIIMSIHTAKGLELHEGDFYKDKTAKQAFRDYYEDLYTCVSDFDNFDIVGHVDIINRYTKFLKNPEINFSEYEDLVVEVLKKVIAKDKGIEVNTSGKRYGLPDFHPEYKILKMYKELGGETITFGSDAHVPKHTGFCYGEVMDMLKGLGFKYIASFENREKKFMKI